MKLFTILSDMPIFPVDAETNKGNYKIQVQCRDVSDGYHTFEELYEHRNRLFLALVKIYDNYITPLGCNVKCWKSKLHHDNTMFDGFFILGMIVTRPPFETHKNPEVSQISYHLPIKYWHLAKVVELERAPVWDGHTSNDVLERLLRL
jgi:hypothetical protein